LLPLLLLLLLVPGVLRDSVAAPEKERRDKSLPRWFVPLEHSSRGEFQPWAAEPFSLNLEPFSYITVYISPAIRYTKHILSGA
jgi:hypothetical protein